MGRSPKAGRRDASPRFLPRHGCRAVYATRLCRTQSQPSIHSLSRGKGGKGDRDNKSEVNFKNRLFLQAERPPERRSFRQSINLLIIKKWGVECCLLCWFCIVQNFWQATKASLLWGVAPVQVVSHLCHRIVQWLCAADCKHPCLV